MFQKYPHSNNSTPPGVWRCENREATWAEELCCTTNTWKKKKGISGYTSRTHAVWSRKTQPNRHSHRDLWCFMSVWPGKEAEQRCLVKKCAKAFPSKETKEQALPAGSMPARLGAIWPHISSYPAWWGDMYHFSGDYMGDKEHWERIMRKDGRTEERAQIKCQKIISVEVYVVRWVFNNMLHLRLIISL